MTIDLQLLGFLLLVSVVVVSLPLVVYRFLIESRIAERERRSGHRYDERSRRAELEELRSSTELQLMELNRRLMESESRWRDANHLVLSSIQAAPDAANRRDFLGKMGIESVRPEPRLVFVLTPFVSTEDDTWQVIKTTCEELGLQAIRGDESFVETDLLRHILTQMSKARLVIANINGRNPNVFYELGIAHALDKPTLVVSNADGQIPFDLANRRLVVYRHKADLQISLRMAISQALAEPQ